MKSIITTKDRWGFFEHQVTTRENLLKQLTWCKENLPELWSELPALDILKNINLKGLAELYYKKEIVCISEIKL